MVKVGTIIYSVNSYGEVKPHIVWNIEDDMDKNNFVFMVSIDKLDYRNNERMCIALDKISNNCFDEDDYKPYECECADIQGDDAKINRYIKKRWNK
jgi:hypothetical protein